MAIYIVHVQQVLHPISQPAQSQTLPSPAASEITPAETRTSTRDAFDLKVKVAQSKTLPEPVNWKEAKIDWYSE